MFEVLMCARTAQIVLPVIWVSSSYKMLVLVSAKDRCGVGSEVHLDHRDHEGSLT